MWQNNTEKPVCCTNELLSIQDPLVLSVPERKSDRKQLFWRSSWNNSLRNRKQKFPRRVSFTSFVSGCQRNLAKNVCEESFAARLRKSHFELVFSENRVWQNRTRFRFIPGTEFCLVLFDSRQTGIIKKKYIERGKVHTWLVVAFSVSSCGECCSVSHKVDVFVCVERKFVHTRIAFLSWQNPVCLPS